MSATGRNISLSDLVPFGGGPTGRPRIGRHAGARKGAASEEFDVIVA